MAEQEARNSKEKWFLACTSVAVGVMLILGIPLWWKATEVYRASLPYDRISQLNNLQPTINVPISVVWLTDGSQKASIRDTVIEKLNKDLKTVTYDEMIIVNYTITSRHGNGEEFTTMESASSLDYLNERFSLLNPALKGYTFYIVDSNRLGFMQHPTYVSNSHSTFIAVEESGSISSIIQLILKDIYVNERVLRGTVASILGTREIKADVESMRAMKSTDSYQLSFTLINAEPHNVLAKWKIQDAVNLYLNPFLSTLKYYSNFTIDSQVLYYTGLSIRPLPDKATKSYYLTRSLLPRVINSIESRLGSHITKSAALNFILYVPEKKYKKLHIRSSTNGTWTHSFLSPRWGGFVIYDKLDYNNSKSERKRVVELDLRKPMQIFVSHLKLLIGIPKAVPLADNIQFGKSSVGMTKWEYSFLIRRRLLENVASANQTLTSLAKLLEEITDIVISDTIKERIDIAVQALLESLTAMKEGDLERAFYVSKTAVRNSEAAFFDPSLLQLLYFPSDQKFAVYVPLFLPICLPVIQSLYFAIKYLYYNTEKEKKE